MSLYGLILILLVLARSEISACPTNCSCYINSVFYTDCYSKGLTTIPSRIPEESIYVHLHYNKIQTIHKDAFQGLTGLTNLYLYQNDIQTVASNAFYGLIMLQNLRLQNNKIQTIHKDTFQGLTGLKYLYLNYNQLSSITPGAFNGLLSLYYLYLNSNQLSSITPGAFNGLPSLYNLYLNSNQLSSITPGAFNGLPSLYNLELSYNNLSSITPGAFNGLLSLNQLRLHRNMLTTINPDIFVGLHGLRSLSLYSNAFTCDCNIRRFRLWLLSKPPYIGTAGARCSSGTYITSLGDNDIICSGEVNLEQTCTVLGSTAECGPNAICKSVDGNLLCKCSTGYYDSNFKETAGICIPEKESDRSCLHSGDSIECVPHAKCIDHGDTLTCTCLSGYYDVNFGVNGGICIPVKNIGDECHQNTNAVQCVPNAECKTDDKKHVCGCSEGFKESLGVCVTDTDPNNDAVTDTKEDSGNVSLILAVVAVCLVTITTVVHLAVCICRKMRGSSKAAGRKNGRQRNENYDNASFEMGTDKNVYDQIEKQEGK